MKKIILGLVLFMYMFVIFSLSHQEADKSTDLSEGVISIVTKVDYDNEEINNLLITVVRKSAHFLLYAGLGIVVYMFLHQYKLNKKELLVYSLLFCIIYACSDEIHQLFINGRSGEVTDVIIDTLGSLTSISILSILIRRKENGKEEK